MNYNTIARSQVALADVNCLRSCTSHPLSGIETSRASAFPSATWERARVLVLALLLALPASADSLFTQQASAKESSTLIAERVSRFEVGDIITVLVREQIDASTQADTTTEKESDLETTAPAAANTFFTAERDEGGFGITNANALPNWQGETENETENTGETTRTSSLTTSVGCFVVEVLPNGNILVEGTRKLTVNREDSTLLVSGMVRSKDVATDNTIPSTLMANATIQLQGKGVLWNNQRRGFLTKIIDWVNPF